MQIPMNHLKYGQKAEVSAVNISGKFGKRLMDMGLLPGTQIKCILKSGPMACYEILGSSIAMHSKDLNDIVVTLVA